MFIILLLNSDLGLLCFEKETANNAPVFSGTERLWFVGRWGSA